MLFKRTRPAAPITEPTAAKELTAKELYDESVFVGPAWEQLGDVTRSVWEEKAKRKNAGDPLWYSCAACYSILLTPQPRGRVIRRTKI